MEFERNFEIYASFPAVARKIAQGQLEEISLPINSQSEVHAAAIVKVFTAFMFEGVLGELDKIFFNSTTGRTKAGVSKALTRNTKIRQELGLDCCGVEHKKIRVYLKALFKFRDTFAHPNVRLEPYVDNEPLESPAPMPEWIREALESDPQKEFQDIFEYSLKLIDASAKLLENLYSYSSPDEYVNSRENIASKYPHLKSKDLGYIASQLKGLLHNPTRTKGTIKKLAKPTS